MMQLDWARIQQLYSTLLSDGIPTSSPFWNRTFGRGGYKSSGPRIRGPCVDGLQRNTIFGGVVATTLEHAELKANGALGRGVADAGSVLT